MRSSFRLVFVIIVLVNRGPESMHLEHVAVSFLMFACNSIPRCGEKWHENNRGYKEIQIRTVLLSSTLSIVVKVLLGPCSR